MKKRYSLFLFIFIAISFILPSSTALAKGFADGDVVFGGTYRLASGESLDGDLVIFGAVVTLEQDSVVNGGVILFGANLDASGKITGDIVGMGGLITLNEAAKINGDVLTIGSHLDKSSGARVMGDVTDITQGPYSFSFPREMNLPQSNLDIFPEFNFAWYVLKIFLWAALATLVVLFFPKASGRVAHAFVHQPLIAGGLGLLTVILAIPLAVIFIVTIVFSPLGLFMFLVLGLCWAFGLIAIGLEIGKRFTGLLNRDWADPVEAALGTFFLILVIDGVNEFIPCIGWMVPAVVGVVGLGAVLMTRFGTQIYPLVSAPYVYPPQAPTPPTPPTSPIAPHPIIAPEPSIEISAEEVNPDEEEKIDPA